MSKLLEWQNRRLVWGVGISLSDSSDKTLLSNMAKLKNTVLHVIDGLFSKSDIENLMNHNISLLVLGYKKVGRGKSYYEKHKDDIESNILFLKENLISYKDKFNGFCFDTLSTSHLQLREQVGEETWSLYYMGDEGTYTFYIDSVNKKFALSSMEETQYDLLDSTEEMFNFIRTTQKGEK